MGMVSEKDRKIFEQLVSDCIVFGLNQFESLRIHTKKERRRHDCKEHFLFNKKRISRHESNLFQQRINEHIRVGFALAHFRYIHSLEYLQNYLLKPLTKNLTSRRTKSIFLGYLDWQQIF